MGHSTGPSTVVTRRPRWAPWLAALLLLAAVWAAFWPSLWNGFNYDDEANIVNNPDYRGLGAEQLRWMWTTFKSGHYQPLSWISLGLDYLLWGERAFGYHLTNLVLHSVNALLVFWLALILLPHSSSGWSTLIGAIIAALVFALHPLRVESVAWVTERRDVLSSFFLLVAVLLYLKSARSRRRGWWLACAVAVYALSLLSRAMGVTLPVILLLLDGYPLRRFRPRGEGQVRTALVLLLEKAPFAILASAAAILAPIAQASVGAAAQLEHHGIEARIAQASYGLVFYLWKTAAPWGLVPMYELQPPIRLLTWKYGLSLLAVIAASAALIWLARRRPSLTVAGLTYAVLLLPVLGLVQSGQQEVADRYSYLPGIVIGLVIGGAIAQRWARVTSGVARPQMTARIPRIATTLMAVGISVPLGVLTWRQCRVWESPETLWNHAIAHGPPSATAHYNLGSVYGQQGQIEGAKQHFLEAVRINPRYPEAFYNLGNTYTELSQLAQAEKAYLEAVKINPNYVSAWYHLGNALAGQGKNDGAILAYREAIRQDPNHDRARARLDRLSRGKPGG